MGRGNPLCQRNYPLFHSVPVIDRPKRINPLWQRNHPQFHSVPVIDRPKRIKPFVSAQLAPNSFSASLLIGRPKPMNSIVSAQLAPNSFSASLLIGRPKPEKPCCQRQGLSPFAIRGTEGRERLDLSRPSVPRMADPPPSDLGADTKKNHKNRLSRCDCLSRCSVYWV